MQKMPSLIDIALSLIEVAYAWCSWRLLICVILAIGIVAGAYYRFPENDGFLPLTSPVGVLIIAFGIWWQRRADR